MMSYVRHNARYFITAALLTIILIHVIGDSKETETVDMRLDIELDRDTRYLTGRLQKSDLSDSQTGLSDPPTDQSDPQTDEIVEVRSGGTPSYVSFLEVLRSGKFTPPSAVENSPGYIDIGFIFVNLRRRKPLGSNLKFRVSRTLESMLDRTTGQAMHFIIITDTASLESVGLFLSHFLSRRLSEAVILQSSRLPPLKITFVDLAEIVKLNPPFIEALKRNTQKKDVPSVDKYSSDLFYVGPLYYKAFEKLDKLLFIDITDLEFFADISELQDHFSATSDCLLGVGLDMSPHYRKFLTSYLSHHPESQLGSPGRLQGFNTGVVLYRLDNMRSSLVYQNYMKVEEVDRLAASYKFNFTLGDQDWFTELGWDRPDLFYILPCHFNAQTSIQYLRPPWEESFDSYHYCDTKDKLKIVHRNGCGPMPQACGYTPLQNSSYWRGKKSYLVDLNLNMETFWNIMADLEVRGEAEFEMFNTV